MIRPLPEGLLDAPSDPCQAQDDEDYFPACNVCEHCDECLENRRQAEAHKARVACQALRASLPVSGEFIEAKLRFGTDECWHFDAQRKATDDLRSKVASMREWPCCPTSKQPLGIEASVRLDEQDHLGLNLGSKRWEFIYVWTAKFTCACGGGK